MSGDSGRGGEVDIELQWVRMLNGVFVDDYILPLLI